jgi:hypothetical protein
MRENILCRYYMLAPEGQYYNYSGCGNTFNCNDPIVRHFILDCLRFWVQVLPLLLQPLLFYVLLPGITWLLAG